MKPILTLLALLVLTAPSAISQERIVIGEACSYYGDTISGELYGFGSDREAEQAIGRIMKFTGLPQNFTIKAANVPNAAAVIRDTKRLILYNQTFMERVRQTTNTDWAAISILAHEIGHHLSGHTLEAGGSRPETELQADRFSGYVLFKMSATLEQAQAAMEAMTSEGGSATHPPKSARLAAIANGWVESRDQNSRGADPASSAARTDDPPPRERPTESRKNPAENDEAPFPTNPPGNYFVAQCTFQDGSVSFVTAEGDIMMDYLGTTINVGRQAPSNDPRIAWLYVIQSNNPTVAAYLNLMGLTGLTYAVDHDGVIWGQNAWGQLVQMGRVTYAN
ncbi:hypothetical protein [Rhodocaloribacter sp.]